MYELILYDLDGTLADRNDHEPMLWAYETIKRINREKAVKQAIITNQAGPACGEKWPERDYPSLEDVFKRCYRIGEILDLEVYIALAYQMYNGEWIYPSGLDPNDPRLDPVRRKPNPGMILQAMADFGVKEATGVLVVGDRDEDAQAADNANAHYMYPQEFLWSFLKGSLQWFLK